MNSKEEIEKLKFIHFMEWAKTFYKGDIKSISLEEASNKYLAFFEPEISN